jgi:hypothetical protein
VNNPGADLNCPVCDSHANVRADSQFTQVNCPVCGQFRLDPTDGVYLPELLKQSQRRFAYRISHALRTAYEEKLRTGGIFLPFTPFYCIGDFTKMMDQPDRPVRERLHLMLRHLCRASEYAGDVHSFRFSDYSIIGLRNHEEARFYLRMLTEQGFVTSDLTVDREAATFAVTGSGWLEMDRLEQAGSQSSIAFIAMWFDHTQDAASVAIHKAIAEAGFSPIRIDGVEHLNRIDDEIIARIRGSRFLVADFTGQRNGVYFEAGFMLGLGRPVIWLCRKDQMDKVHFDTRQYNTIDYIDEADLKKRLKNRIIANLGEGPIRVSKEAR